MIAAAVVVSAMGLGGLHWVVLVVAALAALGACALALQSSRARTAFAPALVPLLLGAFTLLQLVPLPLGVLRALSPHMADVWQGALSPFGEELHWGRLTADPGATLVEALKWASYGWVLVAAATAGNRRGVGFGAMLLFGSASLVGVTTLLHGIVNLHRVYGIYVPTFSPTRWNVGPFLNPNNLAGYLNLGIFCGFGLMLSSRPVVPRVVLGTGVATLLAMVVLGGSRAGVAALLLGVGTFAFMAFRVRRQQGLTGRLSPQRLLAGVAGAAGFAVLLAFLGATDATWHALFDKNVEKLRIIAKMGPLVTDHAWFGVGRGAFGTVFPAYHSGPSNVIYAHAENFVVQWIAEWGIPVGAAAVVAFALLLWRTLRSARSTVSAAGIWCGVLALVSQNMLDLGLELPGVGLAAATALGFLWGAQPDRSDEAAAPSSRRHEPPGLLAWSVVGSGLLLALAVVVFGRGEVTRDRAEMQAVIRGTRLRDTASLEEARAALRAAMLEHPADPYFPRVGGILAWYARQNPMPWVGRALERGMHVGETHLALARMLASAGAKEQALLEARLSCTYSPALCNRAGNLAYALTKDYAEIVRAAPEGEAGAPLLYTAAMHLKSAEYPDLKLRLLQEVVTRQPANAYFRSRFLEELAWMLAPAAPQSSCRQAPQACEALALEQIEAMQRLAPGAPDGVMGKARLWAAVGRPEDAELLLRKECPRFSAKELARCQRQRVYAAGQTGSRELVDAASRDLANAGCASTKDCASLYQLLGHQAERVRDATRALVYFKRAVAEEPNDANLSALARSATAAGDESTARSALSKLGARNPTDQKVERALDAQRRRLLLGPMGGVGR